MDRTKGVSRRDVLISGGAAIAGGALLLADRRAALVADVPGATGPRDGSAADTGQSHVNQAPLPPAVEGRDYLPVEVPNGKKIPWKVVDGVKVFHLIAEEVEHEFAPGLRATC